MDVSRIKLNNGLTVLLRPDQSYPVVSIQLWIGVGSVHDKPTLAGISHFVEHMLFKGTQKRSMTDISRIIEGSGGEINAYTTFEQTTLHVVMASRYWEKGLDVVSDIALGATFPESGVEGERNVIIEEIKEGEDNPDVVLSQRLFKETYAKLPYSRPVIGYRETVQSIGRDDLVTHYKEYYVPGNMVLACAGSFDTAKMLQMIETFFGGALAKLPPAFAWPGEQLQDSMRYSYVQKGQSETIVELAFPVPQASSPDVPALDLLSGILGESDSSRLHQQIVSERGLAKDAISYTFTPQRRGVFLVRISPFKGKFRQALTDTLSLVWNMADEDVSTMEIEKSRALIEKDLIFQEETVYGQARKLAYYESVHNDHLYESCYLEKLAGLGKQDVKKVAETYLRPERLTVVAMYPQGGERVYSKGEVSKMIRQTLVKGRAPYGGSSRFGDGKRVTGLAFSADSRDSFAGSSKGEERVSAPKEATKIEVSERRLDNGVRILARNNKKSSLVSIVAVVPGGVRGESKKDNGISNLISHLIQKGTRSRSYSEIADEVTMKGAYVESFVGKNSFGLKMDVLGRKFLGALGLFFDLLTEAIFPRDHFEMERKRALEEVEAIKDNFDMFGYLEFLKAFYKDHPYSLSPLGTKESLSGISRDELLTGYRRLLDPKDLIISVAGSFDEEMTFGKIKERVGKLVSEERENLDHHELSEIKAPIHTSRRINGKNAYIHFGFRGTRIENHDKYALEIVNAALSNLGDGKLFVHLREKLGLAYTVFSTVFHGIEDGYLLIYINTDPKNVDLVISEIKNVIARFRETGLTDDEIQRVKNYLVGSYEIELQRNSNQAVTLALNGLYGLPLDFDAYSQEIMKVNGREINDVISKYFDLDKYVLSLLTP